MATVEITERCCREDLALLPGEVQQSLLAKLLVLEWMPGFGTALTGKLAGYRGLTHGPIRILYRVHAPSETAFVVMVGLRRDAELDRFYSKAKSLVRAGKLDDAVQQLKTAGEHNLANIVRATRRVPIKRLSQVIPEKRGGV